MGVRIIDVKGQTEEGDRMFVIAILAKADRGGDVILSVAERCDACFSVGIVEVIRVPGFRWPLALVPEVPSFMAALEKNRFFISNCRKCEQGEGEREREGGATGQDGALNHCVVWSGLGISVGIRPQNIGGVIYCK